MKTLLTEALMIVFTGDDRFGEPGIDALQKNQLQLCSLHFYKFINIPVNLTGLILTVVVLSGDEVRSIRFPPFEHGA